MSTKNLTLFCFLLLLSSQAEAWNGFDYETKNNIDIGPGNLVREGQVIEFYDTQDDSYHGAQVILQQESASGTVLQIKDLDLKKERIFYMDNQ